MGSKDWEMADGEWSPSPKHGFGDGAMGASSKISFARSRGLGMGLDADELGEFGELVQHVF